MLKLTARIILAVLGWRIGGKKPEVKKYVLVAAPHTSNWDFPICMAILTMMNIRLRFLAKKELFRFPLGLIMRFFGGMPVDRTKHVRMVDNLIDTLKTHEEMAIMVPVEGTRGYVKEWKSGFYHAAVGAGVPIALGYLDYGKKEGGILPDLFYPSGDYEADVRKIRQIYKNITPRHPELSSLNED
jgi:1-acyl-sn-glycerol-3-phosphate acyltransferase